MDRAFSILNIKSLDDDAREFEGVATTPEPDRAGDVIEPLGAKFKNPLPLLKQHDHGSPIGTVTLNAPTAKGITFKAKVAKSTTPGPLKDRLDLAWEEIKAGLVRAVSIGFTANPENVEGLKSGGRRFKAYEVLELSSVTIPMNSQALITAVRSIDGADPQDPEDDDAGEGDEDPDQDEAAVSAKGDPASTNPEDATKAASGKHRVVRLNDPGRVRPPPFHIRTLHRERRSDADSDNALQHRGTNSGL